MPLEPLRNVREFKLFARGRRNEAGGARPGRGGFCGWLGGGNQVK